MAKASIKRPITAVLLALFLCVMLFFFYILPADTRQGLSMKGYAQTLGILDDTRPVQSHNEAPVLPSIIPASQIDAVMPQMENLTAKAELGRSAWHLLHTMLARYPESPTPAERTKLGSFVQLFAELYPCGDCARDFLGLLAQYPVQTSSRKAAAWWGCSIHNRVNEKLSKPEYDCSNILVDYDCGCGNDEAAAATAKATAI